MIEIPFLTSWLLGSPSKLLGSVLRGEFGPETDWLAVIGAANDHLVGQRLYSALVGSGHSNDVDPEALAYLEQFFRANSERNAALRAQIFEAAKAMGDAGVDVTLIKGAALIARSIERWGQSRVVGDIDVLVSQSDLPVARAALLGLGYEIVDGSIRGHSAGTFFRAKSAGAIDLHRSLPTRFGRTVTCADMRSRCLRIDGSAVLVPDPTLHFVLNITHEMLHDQGVYSGETNIRYLLELGDIAGLYRDEIDWTFIAAKAEADPIFRLALELQSRMAGELLGTDLVAIGNRTRRGAMLHCRRLARLRVGRIGHLEWRMLRRILRLRLGRGSLERTR